MLSGGCLPPTLPPPLAWQHGSQVLSAGSPLSCASAPASAARAEGGLGQGKARQRRLPGSQVGCWEGCPTAAPAVLVTAAEAELPRGLALQPVLRHVWPAHAACWPLLAAAARASTQVAVAGTLRCCWCCRDAQNTSIFRLISPSALARQAKTGLQLPAWLPAAPRATVARPQGKQIDSSPITPGTPGPTFGYIHP